MNKYIFLLFSLSGCSLIPNFTSPKLIIEQSFSENLGFKLKHSGMKLSQVRASICLIKNPERDIYLEKPDSTIAFRIKRSVDSEDYWLMPKKPLIAADYGWYWFDPDLVGWRLKQVFRAPGPVPRLTRHDLGSGDLPQVAINRRFFTFWFDQAIELDDDQSVQLHDNEHSLLALDSILIRPQHKSVEISVKPDQFEQDREYNFSFSGLKIGPLRFIIDSAQAKLVEFADPKILVSERSIELDWLLNNDHVSEVFFGRDPGIHDCLGALCPAESRSIIVSAKNTLNFLSHIVLNKLEANTSYHVIIRSEDRAGSFIVQGGTIRTAQPSQISWSEIMPRPQKRESDEFIELVNLSNQTLEFSQLDLIIENIDGSGSRSCELARNFSWPAAAYILIVGGDFQEMSYKIPAGANIIRLKQKTLCGGLANKQPKIIKLINGSQIVEKFNALLWQSPAGVSINHLDLRGLDEVKNYCYSEHNLGPTPGQKNGPLGSCGHKA